MSTSPPALLLDSEVCALLRVSRRTLSRLVRETPSTVARRLGL